MPTRLVRGVFEAVPTADCGVVDILHTLLDLLCSAVSQAEDPEKLLDQVVNEMQEDLIKMRQASAQVCYPCIKHNHAELFKFMCLSCSACLLLLDVHACSILSQ